MIFNIYIGTFHSILALDNLIKLLIKNKETLNADMNN